MRVNPRILAVAFTGILNLAAGTALAADQPAQKSSAQSEPIYGSQLMTPEEREQYRTKLRKAEGPEERQAIRNRHHAAMQKRAKERGVTLPENPPAAGARTGSSGGRN